MLSTVSSIPFELNSSYYTTVTGNNGLDALSVIESRNATDLYMLPPYIRNTSMITCIIVMVLGIIGNLMVPIVVFRGKDMRNSTNIFLVNLSVADLCVLLICTPTILVEVNSGPEIWPLGEHMCKAVPFVELTVAHASVLTILAISFERYYAICEPLRVGSVDAKAIKSSNESLREPGVTRGSETISPESNLLRKLVDGINGTENLTLCLHDICSTIVF
ncbi:Orexin receptor type [Apis cerana cerana]|uniref:Orexin receptor type n=1 Tax=Apis cerana cerana TaxID=94128 RepID=A0A2A3E5A0_APICC|nr:Orexin receptor type [Apis cerana cerana]